MEMKLNSDIVKTERRKRAWSQEHLASATDLALRTIQRIEKTGSASYESVRALASVFSLDIEELTTLPVEPRHSASTRSKTGILKKKAWVGLAAAAMAASMAAFVSGTSWAEQIKLDVAISHNDEEAIVTRFLTGNGKDNEVQVHDVIRVTIVPTIRDDGKILLSAKIYENLDGKFSLIFEPKLVTADGKEAEIRIGEETDHSFKIRITPRTTD